MKRTMRVMAAVAAFVLVEAVGVVAFAADGEDQAPATEVATSVEPGSAVTDPPEDEVADDVDSDADEGDDDQGEDGDDQGEDSDVDEDDSDDDSDEDEDDSDEEDED